MVLATALAVLAAATPTPQIQAHRGGSFVNGKATYPEATLPAFRAAAKAGFTLEWDIQMTKDGVPIVMHDDTLDRTTVCTGPVAARTAASIIRHCPTDRLGSPGSALGSEATRERIPVPTLAQVLALVHRTGASASIELKAYDPTGASARALAAALRKARVPLSKVIVQSFFPPNLAAAHAAMPGVATSTLTLAEAQGTSIQAAVDAGSTWVSPQFPVDAAYVQAAHAAGLKVVPYTLDTATDVRAAQAAGVDALITDDPSMARRVLATHGGPPTAA
jgi:glycerophosphoryl diester phosphodiesterase